MSLEKVAHIRKNASHCHRHGPSLVPLGTSKNHRSPSPPRPLCNRPARKGHGTFCLRPSKGFPPTWYEGGTPHPALHGLASAASSCTGLHPCHAGPVVLSSEDAQLVSALRAFSWASPMPGTLAPAPPIGYQPEAQFSEGLLQTPEMGRTPSLGARGSFPHCHS